MGKLSAAELAQWLVEKSGGDPADALSAMALVTAGFLKCAPKPAHTRDVWLSFVDRAMALPSVLVVPDPTGDAGVVALKH